ncbi:MAG: TerB family tellurite resistance protein [Anaerolineales bacterium]|nr:TerB family tellurite resistance protein [Anaerolineales bacterium]
MEKFQAIFEILYFLSSVDGEIHPNELNVITGFLSANYGKVNFNPVAVANSLSNLTGQGMAEELLRAAAVFKNSSTAQDRVVVLDFALQLIGADNKISNEEGALFFMLGDAWNIDMPRYLASKGIVI